LGALLALDRLATATVRPAPARSDRSVPDTGIPHEDLVIPSGDHELAGWLLCPRGECPPTPEGRPLVLLAHGWGASYATLLHLAEPLVAAGYPVLLFDVRGHGRNEEVPYVTVRHFRDDVLAATRYAAHRFPERKRVLVGHSLGGAGGVLATEMGAPVQGLVVIAAPADVLEVTADYLRDKGLPGGFLVMAFRPFWWLRVKGTFRHLVPEKKIGRIGQPVLVLHPENDRRVAVGQGERLARAARIDVVVVPGAGHTDVLEHPDAHRALIRFLEEEVD